MGTSRPFVTLITSIRDHPHACGDKRKFFSVSSSGRGSSPRVWGQGRNLVTKSLNLGIIPTRVGTRKLFTCNLFGIGDHPHACGDKKSASSLSTLVRGSSPRVWGQVLNGGIYRQMGRIIPTRVGTRLSPRGLSLTARDHPHACGDKITGSGVMLSPIGSSPRVWGQGIYNGLMKPYERIIPTRVGTRWERNNLHIQA